MNAGLAYGLADTSAAVISGFVCKYLKDTIAFTTACLLTLISQSVFYFVCGGQTDSTLAVVCMYTGCLGIGACYSIVYLMIELRVPSEKLGSSIVIVFTVSILVASLTTIVGFLPQPWPFISGSAMMGIALVTCQLLPVPQSFTVGVAAVGGQKPGRSYLSAHRTELSHVSVNAVSFS